MSLGSVTCAHCDNLRLEVTADATHWTIENPSITKRYVRGRKSCNVGSDGVSKLVKKKKKKRNKERKEIK